MIKGFKCKATKALFDGEKPPRQFRSIAKVAKRKLDMLDYTVALEDLRSPPGNRLEALRGDLAGRYSIRINGQWRICFTWHADGPDDVEIVDYH